MSLKLLPRFTAGLALAAAPAAAQQHFRTIHEGSGADPRISVSQSVTWTMVRRRGSSAPKCVTRFRGDAGQAVRRSMPVFSSACSVGLVTLARALRR